MRNKIALLLSLAILAFVACKKNAIGKDQYATFTYKQTYCADPWPTGSTDSLTSINVGRYLDSMGLYVAGVILRKESEAQLCLACSCNTGKTIYVTTLNSDSLKARYTRLGFIKQ